MKRFCWLSDLHFDFCKDISLFFGQVSSTKADAIVITGDVSNRIDITDGYLQRFVMTTKLSPYFVLGNHDFYGNYINTVRDAAKCTYNGVYLPSNGIVELSDKVALVGVDGWGDGGFGDAEHSPVILSDWRAIKDFADIQAEYKVKDRIQLLKDLAAQDCVQFEDNLMRAARKYEVVVIATHVSPFEEASRHHGLKSDPNWMPWFSCKTTGITIRQAARDNKNTKFLVLTGHTHGHADVKIFNNLRAMAVETDYGSPVIAGVFDIDTIHAFF